MTLLAQLLPTAITSVIVFSLWKCLQLIWYHVYLPLKSPLRHLRGPEGANIILGNLGDLVNDLNGTLMKKWAKEYGETLKFKTLLNKDHLFTMDARAINHIVTHSSDYYKPSITRRGLSAIFGKGLLLVEGAQHRQQRRIMNPAFGPAQTRELADTFLAKAFELRDMWFSEAAKHPSSAMSGVRIDIVPWITRATLDMIGLAGFNYNFDSLSSGAKPSSLGEAFTTVFSGSQSIAIVNILLRGMFPVLNLIPTTESRKIRAAKQTMTGIGKELLREAKAAALASEAGKGETKKNGLGGRDLFSLLVKANMATDLPESQRLSDEDVIAQVPTFLFAGHETISAAVIWSLYSMARVPEAQTKLRNELLSVSTDSPSIDELMALPYLDMVVKETLRMHPPIPVTVRVAMKDDVIPVEKPYMDRYGVFRDTITVAKRDEIVIPILTINRSKELWGPDALEFKPERWNNLPDAVSEMPSIWGHLLSFLSGPRACIGYRFALVEFKAMLFSLVRAFEFEPALPDGEVCSRVVITHRPVLRSDPTRKARLPLLIKPYQKD